MLRIAIREHVHEKKITDGFAENKRYGIRLLDHPVRRTLLHELEREFDQEPLYFLRFLLTLL